MTQFEKLLLKVGNDLKEQYVINMQEKKYENYIP